MTISAEKNMCKATAYWLKDDLIKIKYDKLDMIKEFCDTHTLILKWEKSPKSCWTITDLSNTKKTEIENFIINTLKLRKIKTTNRDILSMAIRNIDSYLYYQSIQPLYSADNKDKVKEVIIKILGDYNIEDTEEIINRYI